MKLDRSHPLAQGLELWLPSQAPYAGGGRWYNIARPYNDGTANGAVAWHGYRNKGYGFTGNGSSAYYQVESTGLNDLPSVGTAIGVSVRWTVTTVGMSALGFGRSSSATPFLVVGSGDTTGSRARAVFRSDAGTTVNFQSAGNYNDGLWHRFFFWRSNTSGGNYRFSVDGVSLSSTSLAANPITIDRLAVGSLIRTTVGSYWNGGVSDAMVWRLGTDDKPLDDLEMMRWDYEEWQRGFPSLLSRNRSVMVFLPAGGGSYTASAALTIGAATISGSGSFVEPVYTATSAVTTAPATASGTATFTEPVYSGSSAVTVGSVTATGSATFTEPVYTATATVTIGPATTSGSASFTEPVYSGSSAVTVGAATASGTGLFAADIYSGSGSVTAGAATTIGSGSFTEPVYTGGGAVSSPVATISGTATFTVTAYTGTAALTAGVATCSGTATFTAGSVTPDPSQIVVYGVELSSSIIFASVPLDASITVYDVVLRG